MNICIVGAGRLGSQLARKLTQSYKAVYIIDQDKEKARKLANEIDAQTCDDILDMHIIFLTLPAEVIPVVVESWRDRLQQDQILVNMATTLSKVEITSIIGDRARVISAKIIGNASEIASGELPIVIIDGNQVDRKIVYDILKVFGKCQYLSEEIVQEVNSIASEEGIYTALKIKERLEHLQLEEEILEVAIRNVAAGTMKAFASGDLGPFAQKLIEKFHSDKNSSVE